MKKIRTILTSILLLLLALTPTVHATVHYPSDVFYTSNALYYNPSCNINSYSGSVSVTGGTVAEMIWNALTSFLTPEQAAGVMGNMQSESGLRPVIHEYGQNSSNILTDTQSAHGIGLIQWSFGRRVNMLNYIQQNNPSLLHYFTERSTYSNLSPDQFLAAAGHADTTAIIGLEIEFLRSELEAGYSGLFSTTSVAEATTYFLEKVERPRNPYIEYHQGRLGQAAAFYNQYSGSTSSTGSTSSSSGGARRARICRSSSSGGVAGVERDNGDINSTALALAWTSRHAWNDPSPAYRAAMEALGIWNGAGGNTDSKARLGGSCDVYVATVMRYSGADPNFPIYLGGQKPYLANNPKYEVIPNTGSTANLRAGDIRIENGGGHIAMVVTRSDGSLGIASASHGERSGDVGGYYHDSSAVIYRLRGN